MMEYKYNPEDYEEVRCEYMTAFYRAYEEKNRAFHDLGNEPSFFRDEICYERRRYYLC